MPPIMPACAPHVDVITVCHKPTKDLNQAKVGHLVAGNTPVFFCRFQDFRDQFFSGSVSVFAESPITKTGVTSARHND